MKQCNKIAKAREQSTVLKKEIEEILPPYQKHLEKVMRNGTSWDMALLTIPF